MPPLCRCPLPSARTDRNAIWQRAQYTDSSTEDSEPSTPFSESLDPTLIPLPHGIPLRMHLERWDKQFGGLSDEALASFANFPTRLDTQNTLSRESPVESADEQPATDESDCGGEDELDDLMTVGLFLNPGDVVELSQAGHESLLAVFVRQIDGVSQFFSVNGRWSHSSLAKITFAIPAGVNPERLQPLLPYLPTDPVGANPKGEVHVPADVAAPVQEELERITASAETIYRTNAPILDTAYDTLAHPVRTRMMNVAQIARLLLSPDDPQWTPPPPALLAVRKALHYNEYRFHSDIRTHRMTNLFAIRPKNDVRTVETVHEWIREFRETIAAGANTPSHATPPPHAAGGKHIDDFLQKARRLIAKSRQYRDPMLGGLGPSKSRLETGDSSRVEEPLVWDETFTDTDQQIINFLQVWVLGAQFEGMAGLHAACASVMQATGCYGPDALKHTGSQQQIACNFTRARGMVFLQEIGVLSPHDNPALYDEELMLPTVRLSSNMEVLHKKAELVRKNPDFRDAMANLRRDWGATTVYCIDDAGAHEIDDGVSIERIDDCASEYWIHVHVANPTAFFDKTHTLTALAAHMTQSVYMPERFYPMIPSWATHDYFSLDKNRPVITFSSRINHNGDVLETKIHHGIIRDVVTITPSELASLLGEETHVETKRLVVGGSVPPPSSRSTPQLTAAQLRDLQDLYAAAQARWKFRTAAGALRLNFPSPSVRLYEKTGQKGLTWHPPSAERARFIQSDPVIEISSPLHAGSIKSSLDASHIVEEMMLLACQTAASWCAERNIPVMYRGTVQPPTANGPAQEQIKQAIMGLQGQGREIPLSLLNQYMESAGRAIAHSAPLAHKLIGVSSYVKVTSPLRRFSDMIAHWQIEAALRFEAQTGRKFNNAAPASARYLPFSRRQMQDSIVRLSPRERIISENQRNTINYWCSVAVMRASNYNEGELPDKFKFIVRSVPEGTVEDKCKGPRGHISEYNLRATMVHHVDAQAGDEWEVELDSVDVFLRSILVRPIRLLGRATTMA